MASKGSQGSVKKGSDCGAHAAWSKATTPASVKGAASESTNYKHR